MPSANDIDKSLGIRKDHGINWWDIAESGIQKSRQACNHGGPAIVWTCTPGVDVSAATPGPGSPTPQRLTLSPAASTTLSHPPPSNPTSSIHVSWPISTTLGYICLSSFVFIIIEQLPVRRRSPGASLRYVHSSSNISISCCLSTQSSSSSSSKRNRTSKRPCPSTKI